MCRLSAALLRTPWYGAGVLGWLFVAALGLRFAPAVNQLVLRGMQAVCTTIFVVGCLWPIWMQKKREETGTPYAEEGLAIFGLTAALLWSLFAVVRGEPSFFETIGLIGGAWFWDHWFARRHSMTAISAQEHPGIRIDQLSSTTVPLVLLLALVTFIVLAFVVSSPLEAIQGVIALLLLSSLSVLGQSMTSPLRGERGWIFLYMTVGIAFCLLGFGRPAVVLFFVICALFTSVIMGWNRLRPSPRQKRS